MQSTTKQILKEELTKSDVAAQIKTSMSSTEFKTAVEKIVKEKIKGDKDLEDKIVEISKNVLTQLFKTLWVRRNMWRGTLSNKSS